MKITRKAKAKTPKAESLEFAAAKAFLDGDSSESVKSAAPFSCRGSRVVGFGHVMRCPLRSTCARVVETYKGVPLTGTIFPKPAPFVQRWSRVDIECSHYAGPTPTTYTAAEVIGDFS